MATEIKMAPPPEAKDSLQARTHAILLSMYPLNLRTEEVARLRDGSPAKGELSEQTIWSTGAALSHLVAQGRAISIIDPDDKKRRRYAAATIDVFEALNKKYVAHRKEQYKKSKAKARARKYYLRKKKQAEKARTVEPNLEALKNYPVLTPKERAKKASDARWAEHRKKKLSAKKETQKSATRVAADSALVSQVSTAKVAFAEGRAIGRDEAKALKDEVLAQATVIGTLEGRVKNLSDDRLQLMLEKRTQARRMMLVSVCAVVISVIALVMAFV